PPPPQQLREWFAQCRRLRNGAAGAGDPAAGDSGAGGAAVTDGAGDTGGAPSAGPGGARTRGTGAARTGSVGGAGTGGAAAGDPAEPVGAGAGGTGAGGAGVGGAGAEDPGAVGAGAGSTGASGAGARGAGAGGAVSGGTGAGGTVRPRPYFVPLLQQRSSSASSSCPWHPAMAHRLSSVPLRIPLPPPPESSRPTVPDSECDLARAAGPTDPRLLATVVTDPSFKSTAASALVAELVDFAPACRLDYATAHVVESAPAGPLSIRGECALGTDVLEDRHEDFECLAAAVPGLASMLLAPEGDPDAPDISTPRAYAEAITGPYSSQWQAAMDVEMASWKSTGTYVKAVPPFGANIVDGMWIFRVKRPPSSPPSFKARYISRGFNQRQWVNYFQTFSPTPKMTTPRVLLHVAAQRDYELYSLDFSTASLQGSLHEEIWLRHPPGFTGTILVALGFTPSTAESSLFQCTDTSLSPFYVVVYITRERARRTITLTQPHMVHQVLQRFGFQFSSPHPTPLSTNHLLSAPPSDNSVEPSFPYLTLGMGLVLGGRGPVVLTGHADASWVDDSATKRTSQGYTFSLCSGSFSWRFARSSLVLSSDCEAEIYAGAMAAQELRWLIYLLTNLGEEPRSPPIMYQRGQVRLAYMATRANTADIFTKALLPGDQQRFSTVLGLLALLFLTGHFRVEKTQQQLKWYYYWPEMLTDVEQHMADMPADEVVTKVDGRTIAADTVNGSELLASPSPGQRRRLGRMYGSSSRPSTVGEVLKRLRQAAGDRCGTAVDKGARQLQLTGLGVRWVVDLEGLFDREVDEAVR
ncbi:unnamed protein product, partial [Closterium sp. NIES-53]